MSEALSEQKCSACHPGAPKVDADEEASLLPQVPDWDIVELDGERQLRRVFDFPDFAAALAFTNRVGELAESAGHHPALLTEYGKVTVRWWTHKIGGLHVNDFIMAARTDEARNADG